MPEFVINVVIDPKGAVSGGKKTDGALKKIDKSADNTKKRMKSVARSIQTAFAGATIAIALASTVGVLRDFSLELSTVQAVTGATAAEFQALSDRARELGATTRFTATSAAQGLTLLGRAGFNVSQSLSAVGDVLSLAQAGALDLASAASITASAVRGFRLPVEEATRVTDVLVAAANSANTNVMQLGQGLKFVAPIAAGLSVSIEETVAAMSALADAGLQSTLAGTGLRRVLAELESPSTNTMKILGKLGVTADDVRVSQVGLTEALQALHDAGVDTGMALEIFGQRGGPAFEVMSNAIPTIRELTGELDEAGGTSARVAKIMDDNLFGAMKAVQSAAEAIVLSFGALGGQEDLTEGMRGLAGALRLVARNLNELGQALVPVVALIAGVRAKAMLAAAGITTLGDAVAFVQLRVEALTVAIAKNPIGILLVALTAVIAALTLFRNEIGLSADRLATLGNVLTVIGDKITGLIPKIAPLEALFGERFQRGFALFASEGLLGFVTNVAQTVDFVIGLFEGMFRFLAAIVKGGFDILTGVMAGQSPTLAGEFEIVAKKAHNAFLRGFHADRLGDVVRGIAADAELLARKNERLNAPPDDGDPLPPQFEVTQGAQSPASALREAAAAQAILSKSIKHRGDALEEVNLELTRQHFLLGLSSRASEREAEVLQIVDALRSKGIELMPEELTALEERISARQDLVAQLAEEAAATDALNKLIADEQQLLQSLQGPSVQLHANLELLEGAYVAGRLSLEEYLVALNALEEGMKAPEEESTRLGQAILSLGDAVGSQQAIWETFTLDAIGSVGDAFENALLRSDNFFEGLARGLASSAAGIARMILQLQLLKFAESIGLPVVSRQHGGSLRAGQPAIVHKGEGFIPATSGRVVPLAQGAGGGGGGVTLKVINVSDPEEAGREIDSGDNDERFLNVLARNPRAGRAALGMG